LVIPFAALTAFADPHVRYGLRFRVAEAPTRVAPVAALPNAAQAPAAEDSTPAAEIPQVVSLADFRRRPAGRDVVARQPADKDQDPA
jgi:hypothetical protein